MIVPSSALVVRYGILSKSKSVVDENFDSFVFSLMIVLSEIFRPKVTTLMMQQEKGRNGPEKAARTAPLDESLYFFLYPSHRGDEQR